MQYTGKRSPFLLNLKMAADKDGKLLGDGERLVRGPRALLRVRRPPHPAPGAVHRRRLRHPGHPRPRAGPSPPTTSWGAAFRAYGSPQAFLASESLMDELAEKMGMDPFELRYKNIYRRAPPPRPGQTPEVFPFPEMFDKLRPLYVRGQGEGRRGIDARDQEGRRHLGRHLRLRPRRARTAPRPTSS